MRDRLALDVAPGAASVPGLPMDPTPASTIRIGISMCLLGEEVRFDGGHKRDAFLVDTFGHYVEWLPLCPEVDIGLGTPREPIHLVRSEKAIRLVGVTSGSDHSDAMRGYAAKKAEELARLELCGFILKKDSPSCGMERVKIYNPAGVSERTGRGLFADAPMAHSPTACRVLGRLVAGGKALSRAELRERYERRFMEALAVIATPKRHANVLYHMLGYFKTPLDGDSRIELAATIEDYRNGLVPLIVPITLVRHHVRRLAVSYLAGQVYLEPHPKELMLRNHV